MLYRPCRVPGIYRWDIVRHLAVSLWYGTVLVRSVSSLVLVHLLALPGPDESGRRVA